MTATVPTDPVFDIPVDELEILDEQLEAAPEPIQKKLLRPQTLISFAVAVAIIAFLFKRMDINIHVVTENIRQANPWLFLAALGIYYFTFFVRTLRWRYMLSQAGIDADHGYDLPNNWGLFQILMLSWFANCIVPAKLGDGYRCYLLKQDANAPGSTTLGTILAERLTDLGVLFVTMTLTGILAFHGHLPGKVQNTVWIGGAMMIFAFVCVVVLFVARDYVANVIPERFRRHYHDFHGAVFACLRQPVIPILVSLFIWCCDGVRLWFVALSLGEHLAIELTLFVALMSALLTTLPFTPAGLGLVEAAVVVVLKVVDVSPDMAGSIAILDRLIGYWSLILVGIILYIMRVRRDVRIARTS